MQEVATVKSWININASPFAWQRILFKLLPEFKKEGFFFHTIQDDSQLSPTLLEKISEALFDAYKIELSTDFLKKTTKEIASSSQKTEENLRENQDELLQDIDKNIENDIFKNDGDDSEDLI